MVMSYGEALNQARVGVKGDVKACPLAISDTWPVVGVVVNVMVKVKDAMVRAWLMVCSWLTPYSWS